MHRIFISACACVGLLACSAPPPPKDPVDISIEPAEEDAPRPTAEEEPEVEPLPDEPPEDELEAGGTMGGDSIGESVGAGGLGLVGRGGSAVVSGYGRVGRPPLRGITVQGGAVTSTGSSGYRNDIRRVIGSKSRRVKYCYARAMQRNPNLQGRVVVHFTIAADGSVARAHVTSGVGAKLDACVVAAVRGAVFPPPPKGQLTKVSYPFVLRTNP